MMEKVGLVWLGFDDFREGSLRVILDFIKVGK